MSEAIPDMIWLNVTSSHLDEENILHSSLKEIGAMIAAIDPDLSTDGAYNLLIEDIESNYSASTPHYTSEINGIPIYFSVNEGGFYVELNNSAR